MNTKAVLAMALASFTFASVLPIADAADKIYPGSNCVQYVTGSPWLNASALHNGSTSDPLQIDCPVVRQLPSTYASGNVRVIDQHPSESVACALTGVHVLSATSSYIWSSGLKESLGASPYEQVLTFGYVGSDSASAYYLSCSVPPMYSSKSSLLSSYKVGEI